MQDVYLHKINFFPRLQIIFSPTHWFFSLGGLKKEKCF